MFIQKFKALLKDERGQSTTEYILILAVVVMIAMKFRGQMAGRMDKVMESTFRQMDGAVDGSLN